MTATTRTFEYELLEVVFKTRPFPLGDPLVMAVTVASPTPAFYLHVDSHHRVLAKSLIEVVSERRAEVEVHVGN